MPASRQKEERMWALADKFAKSGEYSGWWLIEKELESQGFSRAHSLLNDERVRERLDRMCAEARKGRIDV